MTGGRKSRTDIRGGHIGLVATIIALVVIAGFTGARWTLIVAGCFTVWFLLALTIIRIRGGRGGEALRRAYVATFGWGDYITP
ncbi:hypothetical protein [Streptomyces caniscabiei]|uniref:Uncharacterized protein n=1 Tax=Streptomyces caniscabiei TaxID=2746961 RepID=A0A927QGH7_9ACTN|nr:hypothetical protein [Streptomyces caniscabiei]MBD9726223.1 hypothetical protein [Streptomyces caniscabiei]MDX3512444.1 hypothetical protein [Streptomyces caniscabiei]MDX3721749.1 hypothetical protein [Streptomyces caniscabiei]MDX3729641.1 hypothetical protein [Streptomyces caniscabiei]WEO28617.1 hypothetical protein IHE65_38615 [Streptomyces caniscabiei]